jgi:hypothetical protein
MTKHQLLAYLHNAPFADAHQVAADFGIAYPVAAMALLRLVRQALASRIVDHFEGFYRYELSDRGYQRLAYFHYLEDTATLLTSESESRPRGACP